MKAVLFLCPWGVFSNLISYNYTSLNYTTSIPYLYPPRLFVKPPVGISITCWSSINARFRLKPSTFSDCNRFPNGMRREPTASLKLLEMRRLWSGSKNSMRFATAESNMLPVKAMKHTMPTFWRNTTLMASSNGKFRTETGTNSGRIPMEIPMSRDPSIHGCNALRGRSLSQSQLCSVVSIWNLLVARSIRRLKTPVVPPSRLGRLAFGCLEVDADAWGFFEATGGCPASQNSPNSMAKFDGEIQSPATAT